MYSPGPPSSRRIPAVRSEAIARRFRFGRASVAVTFAPARRKRVQWATPVRGQSNNQQRLPELKWIRHLSLADLFIKMLAIQFNVVRQTAKKTSAAIQNRTITFDSLQRAIRSDVKGRHPKMRLPRSLNEPTCKITETASSTKTRPTKNSKISCLMMTATAERSASGVNRRPPLKISAGCALYQRKQATRRRARRRTPSLADLRMY